MEEDSSRECNIAFASKYGAIISQRMTDIKRARAPNFFFFCLASSIKRGSAYFSNQQELSAHNYIL
jgi:hypothetical protein